MNSYIIEIQNPGVSENRGTTGRWSVIQKIPLSGENHPLVFPLSGGNEIQQMFSEFSPLSGLPAGRQGRQGRWLREQPEGCYSPY